jgi:hypothetical protein
VVLNKFTVGMVTGVALGTIAPDGYQRRNQPGRLA